MNPNSSCLPCREIWSIVQASTLTRLQPSVTVLPRSYRWATSFTPASASPLIDVQSSFRCRHSNASLRTLSVYGHRCPCSSSSDISGHQDRLTISPQQPATPHQGKHQTPWSLHEDKNLQSRRPNVNVGSRPIQLSPCMRSPRILSCTNYMQIVNEAAYMSGIPMSSALQSFLESHTVHYPKPQTDAPRTGKYM